jgi:hypothetical protein
MNMATEPTAPTLKAAVQIIAKIILKVSMAGLCSRPWSVPVFAGFWATVSRMMFRIERFMERVCLDEMPPSCSSLLLLLNLSRKNHIAYLDL